MALPQLVTRQKLTSTTWNAAMAEIEARLAAIGGSSIAWPLVAGGNLDMDRLYTIISMRNLWGVINASEYPTLNDAVTAANGQTGGGIVYIPTNTGIEAWAQGTSVVITASNVLIVGAGPGSSTIAITSGAGPFITNTGTLANISIFNLSISTALGTASTAVSMKRVDRFQMGNVKFTGINGPSLVLTHDGTPGNSCSNVTLSDLYFPGGSGAGAHNIQALDVKGLVMWGIQSVSCPSTTAAIYMEPASSAAYIQDVSVFGSRISSPAGKGVSILGNTTSADDKWARIALTDVRVVNPSGTAIEVGSASKMMKDVRITGSGAQGTITGGGLSVCTSGGIVNGCRAQAAGSFGLDITSSIDLFVTACNFQDATTYGVNATSTTDCTITGCNLRDCLTAAILRTSSSHLITNDNAGDLGNMIGLVYKDAHKFLTAGADADIWSYTIPAKTLFHIGSGFRIAVNGFKNTTTDTGTIAITVGGNTVAQVSSAIADAGMILRAEVFLNSAGVAGSQNTDSMGWGLTDAAEANLTYFPLASLPTINWNNDVTVLVSINNATNSNLTVNMISLQFVDGYVGGTIL